MNIVDALKKAERGYRVRCTKWSVGCYIEHSEQTSFVHQNGSRANSFPLDVVFAEWEVVPKVTYNFADAYQMMKQGKWMRRCSSTHNTWFTRRHTGWCSKAANGAWDVITIVFEPEAIDDRWEEE